MVASLRGGRQGGARIVNIKGKGKGILSGIMLVVVATILVKLVVEEFNITGTTGTILLFAPSILGLALLASYLDVF